MLCIRAPSALVAQKISVLFSMIPASAPSTIVSIPDTSHTAVPYPQTTQANALIKLIPNASPLILASWGERERCLAQEDFKYNALIVKASSGRELQRTRRVNGGGISLKKANGIEEVVSSVSGTS